MLHSFASYLSLTILALHACGGLAFVGSPALSGLTSRSLPTTCSRDARAGAVSGIVMMGKGKGVPMNMRGNMEKMRQAQEMRDQLMGDGGADGFPVFTIYARSKVAKVWYPCGSLKGDDRSKALVESWRDNSLFLKDQYKSTLDKGMAKSVFDQKQQFLNSVVKLYPQLKKVKDEIEFGYKVRIKGIEEKFKEEGREDELKMAMLTEDMTQSWFDGLKSSFGFGSTLEPPKA